MFYKPWSTNYTPRKLLDDYYDTRYVTVISTYAAQIIAFFKEQQRQLQADQDFHMPDHPGASGSGSNQPKASSSRNDPYSGPAAARRPSDHGLN